jgi:hypothetical protein
MKSKTAPRLTAPSPWRRRPRLFQDLFLKFQLGDPATQPGELGPLVTTDRSTRRRAFPPQRGDPVAQRLVIDVEFPGDLTDRPVPVDHEHRRLPAELL